MLVGQVSVWLLAAALGQAPAEPWGTLLKVVPGEADVVVRCRGMASAADDVTAMLKAMSPTAAEAATPVISQFVDQWKAQYGADVVDAPVVGMVRVEAPRAGGSPPFAVVVMKDDFKGVLRALSQGKGLTTKLEPGGYVSFASPTGIGQWYAFDGDGFTAFGPDEKLVGGVAKPGEASLEAALTPALTAQFLGGDLGVYVNAARLTSRYEEPIEAMKERALEAVDQAAKASPNGASMDLAKDMYSSLFDSLKGAEALTLNFDFAADGLKIAGRLAAKPGDGKPAEAAALPAGLDKLDPDSAFYVAMNMDASTVQKWQNMSLRALNPSGQKDPAMEAAMGRFNSLGRIETFGSSTMSEGMRMFNVTKAADPKAYIAATEAMLTAVKATDSPFNFYKDVKVEHDVQKHDGVSYSRVTAVYDLEKLAKMNPTPGGADRFKTILGESMSYWIGTDGERCIQVTAPTWEEATARLDRFKAGDSAVGALAGFKQVRSELGDRANFLMIASGQGLVRTMATQLAATANRPDLKAPAGMPTEPAFLGVSLTPDGPGGYDFRFSLPAGMGPVFEKGMIPLFQGLQAPPVAAPVAAPPVRAPNL